MLLYQFISRCIAPGRGVAGKTGIGSHNLHTLAHSNAIHRLLHLHDRSRTLQAASVYLQRFLFGDRCRRRNIVVVSRGSRRSRRRVTSCRSRWRRQRRCCHGIGLITTYQIAHIAITASHQDAQGQITTQTHSTEKHYRLVRRYLCQMLAHFIQRNINSSRNGAERELLGRTGIYQHHFILLFHQLAPRDDGHSTANNIRCHISANGDGVFG